MDTHKRNSIELCATKHFSMLLNLSIGGRNKKDLNARNRVNRNTFRWWIDRKHSVVYKVDHWLTQFWLNITNYEMEIFSAPFSHFPPKWRSLVIHTERLRFFDLLLMYRALVFFFIHFSSHKVVNTHKEKKITCLNKNIASVK